MSIFTSLGILILVALILLFLQLSPGTFMLFSHYSYGKLSRKKASLMQLYYILGFTASTVLLITLSSIILLSLPPFQYEQNNIATWTLIGLLISLGIVSLLWYFRQGSGTKLYISRHTASKILQHTASSKTKSSAFALGFTSGLPELLFTLPLYFMMVNEIIFLYNLSPIALFLIPLVIFIAIVPLAIIFIYYRSDYNLANIQRIRVRNKNFFRAILSISFFLLATIIIFFKALT